MSVAASRRLTSSERQALKAEIDRRRRELENRPVREGEYAHLLVEKFEHIPKAWHGQRRHGTEVMYVHGGCKCLPCRAAHSEARRKRFVRRRPCAEGCGRAVFGAGSLCRWCAAAARSAA